MRKVESYGERFTTIESLDLEVLTNGRLMPIKSTRVGVAGSDTRAKTEGIPDVISNFWRYLV